MTGTLEIPKMSYDVFYYVLYTLLIICGHKNKWKRNNFLIDYKYHTQNLLKFQND